MAHSDIKLDNLMLVDHTSTPFKVKLIDFGLTRFTSDLYESVKLQALGYRAPEVFLGLLPNEAVDIWGLGISLGELYLGQMMLSGINELEILSSIVNLLGQPDKFVLDRACRATHYFTLYETDSEITWKIKPVRIYQRKSGERKETNSKLKSLDDLLEIKSFISNPHEMQDLKEFIDLLKRMLAVNPGDRIKPADALKHDFITMKHLPVNDEDSYIKEAFQIMSLSPPRFTENSPVEQQNTNTSPSSSNPEAEAPNFESLNLENDIDSNIKGFQIVSQCQPNIPDDLPVEQQHANTSPASSNPEPADIDVIEAPNFESINLENDFDSNIKGFQIVSQYQPNIPDDLPVEQQHANTSPASSNPEPADIDVIEA
ncbi:homeodomain-interacting protein kinase 2, partial [Austrofundulus limnaeus]|uniref:Homeodomain-interacting protein kinase 2 n=1 Tax=Austrofundulus limnaeus TaxID=52670 RepID=A0A2I4AM90_AUSLI